MDHVIGEPHFHRSQAAAEFAGKADILPTRVRSALALSLLLDDQPSASEAQELADDLAPFTVAIQPVQRAPIFVERQEIDVFPDGHAIMMPRESGACTCQQVRFGRGGGLFIRFRRLARGPG